MPESWWAKRYRDEFSDWSAWRGEDGKLYASRRNAVPPVFARAGDADGLAEALRQAEQDGKSWWEREEGQR